MFVTKKMAKTVFFFCCLLRMVLVIPAARVAVALKPSLPVPSYGVLRVWKSLSACKKLEAYQIFNTTPLHELPPGLVPLILDYLCPYSSFSVTAQQLGAERKHRNGEMTPVFLNDCPKPLLAVHPTISTLYNGRPLLHIYWKSVSMHYDSLANCFKTLHDFTDEQKVSPSYLRRTKVSEVPSELNDSTMDLTGNNLYECSKFPIKDPYCLDAAGVYSANEKEAEDYLDVCISDFDHESKSGSLLEGCRYSMADHEVRFALMHVCGNRLTDEELAELEIQVQEESKNLAALAKK